MDPVWLLIFQRRRIQLLKSKKEYMFYNYYNLGVKGLKRCIQRIEYTDCILTMQYEIKTPLLLV